MAENKPNIFFITIDSLRHDHCFGKNRTTKTPNIDSLIRSGAYFTQAISSADQTGTSLASIFTGLFPSTTGLTHFNFNPETQTYFDNFQKNGYFTSGFFPDHDFFTNISSRLNEKNFFEYNKLESWKNLSGGIGDLIIKKLKELSKHSPWLFSIHIMDLHNLFALPKEYDTEEFGKNRYERMLSFIDTWLGKFIENIDFTNTLIVISSDHGSYIPLSDTNPDEIPTIQGILKKGKKIAPKLEPVGLKALLVMRKMAKEIRMKNLKTKYTEYELRSLKNRGKSELFDETIRVPLLFSGFGIKKNIVCNDLVRHVDIFPTITEIIELKIPDTSQDGRSLVPFLNSKNMKELPAYIETGVSAGDFTEKVNPQSKGKIIGVRTSTHKLLRERDNPKKKIFFDLTNDPNELTDISSENLDIQNELDNILNNFLKTREQEQEELTDEEQQKAEELLKKLGYI